MEGLQEKIVNFVRDAGGVTGWKPMVDSLAYPERQRALATVRGLQADGILKRVIKRNPNTGKMDLTIELVGA